MQVHRIGYGGTTLVKSKYNREAKINEKLKLFIELPSVKMNQAERIMNDCENKTVFVVKGKKTRINQHATKHVFSDNSYVIVRKATMEAYDSQGKTCGSVKHLRGG